MDTTLTQTAVAPLASGLTLCDDGLIRPTWASRDELLRSYYDTEWGLPIHDEAGVFERLVLEGFQAGLSWRTVLAKRGAFRAAFAGFSPDRVAAFTGDDIERLSTNPEIIRNRRKIESAISNARATVAMRSSGDSSHGPTHLGERSSPVEWCNRFVSFGLGYALSWSGVSSCPVGCGVSRDLVRMSRLR